MAVDFMSRKVYREFVDSGRRSTLAVRIWGLLADHDDRGLTSQDIADETGELVNSVASTLNHLRSLGYVTWRVTPGGRAVRLNSNKSAASINWLTDKPFPANGITLKSKKAGCKHVEKSRKVVEFCRICDEFIGVDVPGTRMVIRWREALLKLFVGGTCPICHNYNSTHMPDCLIGDLKPEVK